MPAFLERTEKLKTYFTATLIKPCVMSPHAAPLHHGTTCADVKRPIVEDWYRDLSSNIRCFRLKVYIKHISLFVLF